MNGNHHVPPGKMGLPVIGESIEFGSNPKKFVLERYKRYGPIFKSHILGSPMVFMVGPDALHVVLIEYRDHLKSGEGWPKGLGLLMGGSLLMTDGDAHRKTRAQLSPAFHGPALEGYISTIESTVLRYIEKWEQKHEFAWYKELKLMTFELASHLLLGTDPGSDITYLNHLFDSYNHGMHGLNPVVAMRLPWTPFGRAMVARDKLLHHITQVVRQRQESPTNDAISLMVQAHDEEGNKMTLQELSEHALFLLYAGHESTTSLLTSFCLELARHPDVLQHARDEQHDVVSDGMLSFERIKRMQYLDRILLEIERLHPPFTGGFRLVVKPFEFNGCYVPAGWRLFYTIIGTHHLDAIYPEPEKFDPDRFITMNAQKLRRDNKLAGFGGGSRLCLGMDYARLEAKIFASILLRSYSWELLPGQNLESIFVPSSRPKDGLCVSFQRLPNSIGMS